MFVYENIPVENPCREQTGATGTHCQLKDNC